MSTSTAERRELQALTHLAFDELGRATGGIGGMHRAVAGRAFAATGPFGRPVQLVHDGIAGAVYGSLRLGAQGLGRAAGAALSRRQAVALSETPRGAALIAAINGLIGDLLVREGNDLAMGMTVRVGGRAVDVESMDALREAYAVPRRRIVVFLHGLMETEHAWCLGGRETYGERLTRDLGVSTVEVRYNTGLAIADNGRTLSELLTRLDRTWPVPVREIAIVGHSMGGLVARAACHHGQATGARWVRKVRQVASLGSPFAGAPLARISDGAAAALQRLPETRMFGGFLARRSRGIEDLKQGISDPPLPGVRHCYVSAALNPIVGDGLVKRASACPEDAEYVLHLDGVGHLALLNHPEVYAKLREWLEL